jgi:hypothetical protein
MTLRLTLGAPLASALAFACSGAPNATTAAIDGSVAIDGSAAIDSNATEELDASEGETLPRIELADKMNYVFHSTLSAVTTQVKANSDITFDWSAATVDMLGRKLSPLADVDMMQLMLWRYNKDAFLTAINQEDLQLGRMVAMGYCDTKRARSDCRFFDLLAPAGTPIPQDTLLEYVNPKTYSPDVHVWAIMLATGRMFGQGTRLLAFFQPTEGETNDQVRLGNESTTLSYTVDLEALEPIQLAPHTGDVVLSWADASRLTKNGMGAEWVPTCITDVTIARYVGYSIADLERQFLLLQDLAQEQYTARLKTGQEVALARLADGAGNPFPGIDENGIWLFSLTCGACRNPAPWFLSILQPHLGP